MLFTTPTQWLAVAIALVAGWLFGLASHPGGRKWKVRYADERDIHGKNRKEFDARLAERDKRIKELERENAQLAKARPVMAPAPARTAPEAVYAPGADTVARPAGTTRARWFDWNNRVGTNG